MEKVIVVTGGRRGIGKSIVEKFLKEGYNVASCSKNEENKSKENLLLMKCDVSNLNDVKKFYDKVMKKFKRIDVLVNNAGVLTYNKFKDTKIEEINNMIDVDLKGCMYTTKIFYEELKKSKGILVNISSVAGLKPYEGLSIYCAAKYGVVGFSETLRKETKDFKVYCVCPGAVETDMLKQVMKELPKGTMKPEEVGQKVYDCIKGKYKEGIVECWYEVPEIKNKII